jgi:hypothetical protein
MLATLLKIFYGIIFFLLWLWAIKYRKIVVSWTWKFVWAEKYIWNWWTYLVIIIMWLFFMFLWVLYPFWWLELLWASPDWTHTEKFKLNN